MNRTFLKKSGVTLLAGVLLLLLAGCVSEASTNAENAKRLRVGMTKAEVLAIMGEPVKETFATPDRWYYFINPVWSDGLTTEEECLPLIFEKGRLAGWGKRYALKQRSVRETVKGNTEK
jgi:outer membrane protein assembly factor BamE (lipoprotein component of BamABCDE complex)